jgi:hypothetical protein
VAFSAQILFYPAFTRFSTLISIVSFLRVTKLKSSLRAELVEPTNQFGLFQSVPLYVFSFFPTWIISCLWATSDSQSDSVYVAAFSPIHSARQRDSGCSL